MCKFTVNSLTSQTKQKKNKIFSRFYENKPNNYTKLIPNAVVCQDTFIQKFKHILQVCVL